MNRCCLLALAFLSGAAGAQRFRPYSVSPDFKEVTNRATLYKVVTLAPEHKQLLRKNLFVVAPSDDQQLFWVYGNNDYRNLPSLVTSDTVLHLYHVFYDGTLRQIEQAALLPKLKRLTQGMLSESLKQLAAQQDSSMRAAALRNVAYFAVAQHLLDIPVTQKLPSAATEMVQTELSRVQAASGSVMSAIFPYKVDYSQFIVRGHYTKSENLKRFFRGMTWFGLMPFALTDKSGQPQPLQIRQAMLTADALHTGKNLQDWEAIYEPTTMFVGTSNMLTPSEFKTIADQVIGSKAVETTKFPRLIQGLRQYRSPRIVASMRDPQAPGLDVQLRFMGRRYIPDSEMLQRVTGEKRWMPSGLDVMAVLGSNRAAEILDGSPQTYNPQAWADYVPSRNKLEREFAQLPGSSWSSNLYWGWLNALRPLLARVPAGYPEFMRSEAWTDKNLSTALASWTQLRHDTILYGEQSVAEMGDGDEEPPFVPGFVEPNVAVYERLLSLASMTRRELVKRGLLNTEGVEEFRSYETLLDFLRDTSVKELAGQKLTRAEHKRIRHIEADLEDLTVTMLKYGTNFQRLNDDDMDMALVADVHTGDTSALEEAVGHADHLIAVVPIEGKLYFARGSVFSYYEFTRPVSDRMTDEAWKTMLKEGKQPTRPRWTSSFFTSKRFVERE